jgi:hypothetical protein
MLSKSKASPCIGTLILSFVELVTDKIHAPTFMLARGIALNRLPMCGRTVTFRTLTPNVRPLLEIAPVYAFVGVYKPLSF